MAIFNRDVIKVYGVGVPGWGPTGLAAGVLANDVPDQKHHLFLLYGLAVMFGGLIGMDSFLVGDNRTGFFRLICSITVFLAPVSILYWVYQAGRFILDTEEVVAENSEFFGAPKSSVGSRFFAKFPMLESLLSPVKIIQEILQPFQQTAEAAIKTVDGVVKTVDDTVKLGKTVVEKGSGLVDQVSATVEAVSQAGQVVPGVSLYSSITPEGLKDHGAKAAAVQAGGALLAMSDLNPVHKILVATVILIILGGFSLTYYRSKDVQRNDTPPEPGVFRKSDREEHRP